MKQNTKKAIKKKNTVKPKALCLEKDYLAKKRDDNFQHEE